MPNRPASTDGSKSGSRLSLRERNKLRTRQELLDAALAVFAESGFGSATVEAIAAQAGASKVTLYTYFPDGREELFRVLYEQVNDQLIRAAEVETPPGGDWTTRVSSLMGALLEVATTPHIGRFYCIDDPALDAALTPVRGRASQVWTDLIERDMLAAIEAGELSLPGEPRIVAVLLVGTMRAALVTVAHDRERADDILRTFSAMVRSLATRPSGTKLNAS